MKKVYVNFKIPADVKTFISRLYSSTDSSVRRLAVETFEDKECTVIECEADSYRTLDGLYAITKTYYPLITKEKLISKLMTMRFKVTYKYYDLWGNLEVIERILTFKPILCSTIRDYTCYFSINNDNAYNSSVASYKRDCDYYKTGRKSWMTYFNEMGIHSSEDYIKFINKRQMKTFNVEFITKKTHEKIQADQNISR